MPPLQIQQLKRAALAFGAVFLAVYSSYLFGPTKAKTIMADNSSPLIAATGMQVAVHYQGRLEDGTVFDDSHKRGEPITFTLGKGQVIPGWEQGIEGMSVGEKRTLTIPPELGYGAQGAGDVIPPNATLTFDVELVSATIPARLQDYDVAELKAAQKDGAIIIDIRALSEWQATGIIEGAHAITGFGADGGVHPEFLATFRALAPNIDDALVVYCHSGNRTTMLGGALVEQLGYRNVAHLQTGITGWLDMGETTVPYTS